MRGVTKCCSPQTSRSRCSRDQACPGWVRKNSSSLNSVEVSSTSLSLLKNPARGPIDAKGTHGDCAGAAAAPAPAPQMRLDAGHQFARAERFRDVVVAADFETQHAIDFFRPRGQKDNRRAREFARLPDAAAKIESILARQHHVEHDQIGLPCFEIAQRVACAGEDARLKPAARQVVFDQRSEFGFIFDDRDFLRHI